MQKFADLWINSFTEELVLVAMSLKYKLDFR